MIVGIAILGALATVLAVSWRDWRRSFTPAPLPIVQGPSDGPPRNCNEARRRGLENIPRGSPNYASWLDGDNDGLACEPWPAADGPPRVTHPRAHP